MIIAYFLFLNFFFDSHYQEQESIIIVNYDEVVNLINSPSDKTKVFNFWATWCGPCVEEMPIFRNIIDKVNKEDYEFYFISLDDPADKGKADSLMAKFHFSKGLFLINNLDFNSWIDKIEPKWSGSIPMTLIITKNNKNKYFKESNFANETQLHNFLKQNLSYEKN